MRRRTPRGSSRRCWTARASPTSSTCGGTTWPTTGPGGARCCPTASTRWDGDVMAAKTASLPDDLRDILAQLEASDREAHVLLHDLNEEQLNWRPDERSWSIAQCLDHLNVTDRIYLAPMLHAIEKARKAGSVRRGPLR